MKPSKQYEVEGEIILRLPVKRTVYARNEREAKRHVFYAELGERFEPVQVMSQLAITENAYKREFDEFTESATATEKDTL